MAKVARRLRLARRAAPVFLVLALTLCLCVPVARARALVGEDAPSLCSASWCAPLARLPWWTLAALPIFFGGLVVLAALRAEWRVRRARRARAAALRRPRDVRVSSLWERVDCPRSDVEGATNDVANDAANTDDPRSQR